MRKAKKRSLAVGRKRKADRTFTPLFRPRRPPSSPSLDTKNGLGCCSPSACGKTEVPGSTRMKVWTTKPPRTADHAHFRPFGRRVVLDRLQAEGLLHAGGFCALSGPSLCKCAPTERVLSRDQYCKPTRWRADRWRRRHRTWCPIPFSKLAQLYSTGYSPLIHAYRPPKIRI